MHHHRGLGRTRTRLGLATLALTGAGLVGGADAQLLKGKAPATPAPAPAAAPAPTATAVLTRHLVNPNDPIAIVNGEPITRQQLADEAVARKGEEILEGLIGRRLIEQAIRARKVEVTQAEIDAEIDRVAQSVAGVSRSAWLATLSKERKISPAQYARDIIYPSLALRKVAAPLVQVTDQDVKDAFAAQFGEKLRARMIMLNSLPIAKQVWEDLKKNPGLFDKLAQEKSIDAGTRSVGGLLAEPINRHAYPRNVSDAAFAQLVDVDPKLDPKSPEFEKYKPKDGDVSGIIQVTEATWIILKREGIVPARPYDVNDKALSDQFRASVFDAKLQEKIAELYASITQEAAIENRLTGQIKLAGREEMQATADREVQRMSAPDEALPPGGVGAAPAAAGAKPAPATAPIRQPAPPAGVAPADAQRAAGLLKKATK
jgi:foldase protein PrsA